MKIRNGFVSNSSSSSFLVDIYVDWLAKRKRRAISRQQEKKLKQCGFKRTNQHTMNLETTGLKEDEKGYSYGYSVVCNQDDVIEFLVKNKIPFNALIHYGHESMLYDGKSDEVDIFQNFGIRAGMYGMRDPHDLEYPPHERVKYPIEYPTIEGTPSNEELLKMAEDHPPPQKWFDEEE